MRVDRFAVGRARRHTQPVGVDVHANTDADTDRDTDALSYAAANRDRDSQTDGDPVAHSDLAPVLTATDALFAAAADRWHEQPVVGRG